MKLKFSDPSDTSECCTKVRRARSLDQTDTKIRCFHYRLKLSVGFEFPNSSLIVV